jgi:RNA polymerase Rpb5, C-terminal domain
MIVQQEMTKTMLARRGYDKILSQKDNHFIASNGQDFAIAYFIQFSKVAIDTIKTIFMIANESRYEIKSIIIVYATSLTPEAKNAVALTTPFTIEPFTFDEMSYDLLSVVPRHSVAYLASASDKPKEWHKFPIILSTDRVARYLGFKKGDVIKIVEESGLAYRRCV